MDNLEYRGLMNTLTGIRNTLDAILVEIKHGDLTKENVDDDTVQDDECFTFIQACSYAGVCSATFYRWVRQGMITPVTRYGIKTYLRSDIDNCLRYKKPNHKEV